MTAIAIQHRDEIIDQVSQGVMLEDVANKLGIKPPNISKYLADDPEYKLARQFGIRKRLAQAQQAIDEVAAQGIAEVEGRKVLIGLSKELSNLARVREVQLKAQMWFAEREDPDNWGRTDKLQVEHVGDLGDRLRRSKSRIIDITPEPVGVSLGVSEDKRTDESDNNQ